MSEPKVRLSLVLQGGTMLSKQECLKNPKKKDCYDYFSVVITNPKTKKREVINVSIRKSKTIKQNIQLSKEAYDYMTGKENIPVSSLKKEWKKWTIEQRLKYHCSLIAEDFGAIDFSFEVLDD